MNLSIFKSFAQYRFGFACVKREMKKLSVDNFLCTVCIRSKNGTVGTIVSSICETSCTTIHCHDEEGNGNYLRKSFGERMMSNRIKNRIE